MNYLKEKIDFFILDELKIGKVKNEVVLFLLAMMLLITSFYVSTNTVKLLSIIFVFAAVYIGQYKYGLLASLLSIMAVSFSLEVRISLKELFPFFVMLALISLGVSAMIRYYVNLIKDLNLTKEELKESNRQLSREFDRAKRVHSSFLPKEDLKTKKFTFDSFYKSAEITGGDYYNCIELGDKIIGYIAVVTGHGLDGSIINIFVREKINYFLNENSEISSKKILEFLSGEFRKEDLPADYSLYIIFWVLDKNKSQLYYNNAGNHILIYYINDNGFQQKVEKNPPISSVFSLQDYNFAVNKIDLESKNRVLFLTEGLIEQQNQDQIYGFERLEEIIKKQDLFNPDNLLDNIYADVDKFLTNNSQQDDITMFSIQRNG